MRWAHQDIHNAWLKDAYGMEIALIPVLENHGKVAKDYPEFQARTQELVEETKGYARMINDCLARPGEKPSAIKSIIGGVTVLFQSVATAPFRDELVRTGRSDFAAENFEIVACSSLMTAAMELGDQETTRACEQIRDEEQDMADWLDEHLPLAVLETIHLQATEHK